MNFQLPPVIDIILRFGPGFAAIYETYAVGFDGTTISILARRLAANHHQVYIFSGFILAALAAIELFGTALPLLTRCIVLFWIFVFGHIFWGFCL